MADETAKPDVKDTAETSKQRKLLALAPRETEHEVVIGRKTLRYVARAGVLPLVDEMGATEAEVFFTAYELLDVPDRSRRPLTFAFNGGPGSSSIWLHMGALGPRRVKMEAQGWMPQPPFRCVDNPLTWLDRTDLVFVDPVGTGFSRAARPDSDKKYWSFQGDLDSVGEFIRLYLTRYQRWTSPLFLAGESYGTTRAAGLSEHLVDRGIACNGIILISTVLDFSAIRFMTANDLPFQLFVPTYAATAWYHRRLAPALQRKPLAELLAEVKTWCEGEYTLALMKGDRLAPAEREKIAKRLAAYVGLDVAYVLGTNLRVEIFRFCKELLRDERRSVGRLDSRFKGIEALAVTEHPEFDPSMLAITPPYTSAFNQYVRSSLGVETDLVYEVLSSSINEKWTWENGRLPATGETLRAAIAKNPYMRVLVAQGTYDLATPLFATEYMLTHMNVDAALRANVQMATYEAGHMLYLDEGCLAQLKSDVDAFLRAATPK
ncbi:MAG: peptidase S10 [Candidatus Bipolaricaulota bacterium]